MLAEVFMATLLPFGHSTQESVPYLGGLKVIFDGGFDRLHPVIFSISDTTLKQQGTKQQHPDSWSFLVKEQAGQRLSSLLLIPVALWARERHDLQYKPTKQMRACIEGKRNSVSALI